MTEQSLFCDATAASPEVCQAAAMGGPRGVAVARRRPAHDVRSFNANALLFAEGAPAQSLHVVVEGRIMLFKLLPDGRRHIVDIVGAGTMIGMSSAPTYSYGAKAMTAGRVRSLSRRQVETSPELHAELQAQLLARLDAMQGHALRLGRMNAAERIASFLWRLAQTQGTSGGISTTDVVIGLSLGEIADHLGLVQETVCRNLAALKKAGIIAMPRPDRFRVADADELSRLALAPSRLGAAA